MSHDCCLPGAPAHTSAVGRRLSHSHHLGHSRGCAGKQPVPKAKPGSKLSSCLQLAEITSA